MFSPIFCSGLREVVLSFFLNLAAQLLERFLYVSIGTESYKINLKIERERIVRKALHPTLEMEDFT